ncbi:uncharacterized protein MONOS_15001 [Monocercomonoides exilis]|uniref:uncharacterized protein n=1 Tax=Monocercomonoides exilis TaxID=2049356 RepID=UPI003559DC9F|nr:hypothetical protein MONOS_15001 [Monocercomonoides exilis]|eukprot:MONOS_15001.1-p1 / transcript=MONOS_15001.1 / gene=MONOS_15001 / organism=Monocercomonoides_exilis_PA203 / gene_product=unspecified product / transcript_product=unspecified product / location=Mono_scaffold01123:14543-15022(+) / protein_length=125 / sequence_SO=supercontig / SO=protein_coding / is_pseudo=false
MVQKKQKKKEGRIQRDPSRIQKKEEFAYARGVEGEVEVREDPGVEKGNNIRVGGQGVEGGEGADTDVADEMDEVEDGCGEEGAWDKLLTTLADRGFSVLINEYLLNTTENNKGEDVDFEVKDVT